VVLLLLNLGVSAPLQGSPSAVNTGRFTPKYSATMKIQQKCHLNLLSSKATIHVAISSWIHWLFHCRPAKAWLFLCRVWRL